LKGQSIESFVQETLEETLEEEPATSNILPQQFVLTDLPDPDLVLPPFGSQQETDLRQQLATILGKGSSLSQLIIDERGER